MRHQIEPGLAVFTDRHGLTSIGEISIFAEVIFRLPDRDFHGKNVATVATFVKVEHRRGFTWEARSWVDFPGGAPQAKSLRLQLPVDSSG